MGIILAAEGKSRVLLSAGRVLVLPTTLVGEAQQHGTENVPSLKILSAFASEMPLTVTRIFLGVNATASTVW